MGRFEGQVAVVTGGGSGIGRVVVEGFVREGGRAAILGRTAAKLDAVVQACGPEHVLAVAGSHDDPAAATRVIDGASDRWGRIDLLFNNAGTFDPEPVIETTDTRWQATLAANLTGPFVMSRATLPLMRRQRRGVVIHNASTLGLRPIPGVAAYAVAKAGLVMLGTAMALEEAPHGIRVLTVCPGVVDTPIHLQRPGIPDADAARAFCQDVGGQHPLGRVGSPEDVARLVLFLASDDASWMTGSVVTVDGGIALV